MANGKVIFLTCLQTLQVSRISHETQIFGGIFMISRRETSFLTHFAFFLAKFMKISPNAISQEPEEPHHTYQNACT